jgi:hypothetical protein
MAAKHRVNQGAASASVSISERMDGLELRVGDRSLGQQRQIGAPGKSHEIVD